MVVAGGLRLHLEQRTTEPRGSLGSRPMIASLVGGSRITSVGGLIVLFVLFNAAVIVGVVLFTGDDDDSKDEASARIPRPGSVVTNRAIGARIRMPKGWVDTSEDRAIVLRSPDQTTVMTISHPPGAVASRQVVRSAVAAIEQRYRRVRARPIQGKVAGLPAVSRVVTATNRRRVRLNILVSSPQGRERAWLVQVFSGPGARATRLPEAQVSLGTLRLRG